MRTALALSIITALCALLVSGCATAPPKVETKVTTEVTYSPETPQEEVKSAQEEPDSAGGKGAALLENIWGGLFLFDRKSRRIALIHDPGLQTNIWWDGMELPLSSQDGKNRVHLLPGELDFPFKMIVLRAEGGLFVSTTIRKCTLIFHSPLMVHEGGAIFRRCSTDRQTGEQICGELHKATIADDLIVGFKGDCAGMVERTKEL